MADTTTSSPQTPPANNAEAPDHQIQRQREATIATLAAWKGAALMFCSVAPETVPLPIAVNFIGICGTTAIEYSRANPLSPSKKFADQVEQHRKETNDPVAVKYTTNQMAAVIRELASRAGQIGVVPNHIARQFGENVIRHFFIAQPRLQKFYAAAKIRASASRQ